MGHLTTCVALSLFFCGWVGPSKKLQTFGSLFLQFSLPTPSCHCFIKWLLCLSKHTFRYKTVFLVYQDAEICPHIRASLISPCSFGGHLWFDLLFLAIGKFWGINTALNESLVHSNILLDTKIILLTYQEDEICPNITQITMQFQRPSLIWPTFSGRGQILRSQYCIKWVPCPSKHTFRYQNQFSNSSGSWNMSTHFSYHHTVPAAIFGFTYFFLPWANFEGPVLL